MSSRVRAPAPSDSAIHARARSGPAGRTSSSGVSRSVTRCSSPACSRYAGEREQPLGPLGGVGRRQPQGVLGEQHRLLRARRARPRRRPQRRPSRRAPRPAGGWRARDAGRAAPGRRPRRRAPGAARAARDASERWRAAAPSSGCEARTCSPSTRSSPASIAASTRSAPAAAISSPTLMSPLNAAASRIRRWPSGSAATRVPRTSSTASGTISSAPIAGRPPAASVRPSSSANSGLPSVASATRRSSGRETLTPEPPGEQPRVGVEVERADVEPRERAAAERALERSHAARAAGEQEADLHAVEPPRGEAQGLGGRRVEPLQVVDRDQHRPCGRQRPQPVEQAERDRPGSGASAAGSRRSSATSSAAPAARAARRACPRRRRRRGRSAR